MNGILNITDFIIHFDKYLGIFIESYGILTYLFLFLIIFFETGVVITPFLPGDSLLFITGTFAAKGFLNLFLLFFLLSVAAILGDTLNYWIGKFVGERFFLKRKLIKKEYIERTNEFYKKHGGKTIILARFVPIIRTFAPFVAGVGKMDYTKFLSYNVIGGIVWIFIFLFAGYYFGSIPFVKNNLTLFIILIVIVSFIPVIFEYLRHKRRN